MSESASEPESTFIEGEGRGAWTLRGKENGMTSYGLVPGSGESAYDGAAGAVSEWHNRVRRGVRAIDKLLTLAGVPDTDEDGKGEPIFDKDMKTRVMAYQASVGITSTFGYVGSITMRHLTRHHIETIAREHDMAARWLYGQIMKESGFDPGAQGWSTPFDSGLCQHNTRDTDTTLEQAYDPITAMTLAAKRWVSARDRFLAQLDGVENARRIAIDAAILQHKSPAAARYMVENKGTWFGPESEEYVRLTRMYARDWEDWKP